MEIKQTEWIETKCIERSTSVEDFQSELNSFLFDEWEDNWDLIDIKYQTGAVDEGGWWSALIIYKVDAATVTLDSQDNAKAKEDENGR